MAALPQRFGDATAPMPTADHGEDSLHACLFLDDVFGAQQVDLKAGDAAYDLDSATGGGLWSATASTDCSAIPLRMAHRLVDCAGSNKQKSRYLSDTGVLASEDVTRIFRERFSSNDSTLTADFLSPVAAQSGLLLRRGRKMSMDVDVQQLVKKDYKDALVKEGYCVGPVIGRSRVNFGFAVVALKKGENSFAAKGTNEAAGDGVLASKLSFEYDILHGLSHQAIVRVEHMVEAPTGCAMVMELCGGMCLELLMPKDSALRAAGRHAVLFHVLDAVSYLHDRRFAHRDLHGMNVMVDVAETDGDGGDAEVKAVKLVDFNSAVRVVEEGFLTNDMEDLTHDILPPERDSQESCPMACDVFAVGLLAAGLVAGRPMFTRTVVAWKALSIPRGALELSPAAQEHVKGMLAFSERERRAARVCLEALPTFSCWLA